jgi:DNA-binding NarL/FixJ family response regulator
VTDQLTPTTERADDTPVRVLLAEDNPGIRMALRRVIETEPGWDVCGEAGDGIEAIELAKSLDPDLVVMDIGLPKLNGVYATEKIKALMPQITVVAYSVHTNEAIIKRMLKAGAIGYVSKSSATKNLLKAAKSALAGIRFIASSF